MKKTYAVPYIDFTEYNQSDVMLSSGLDSNGDHIQFWSNNIGEEQL